MIGQPEIRTIASDEEAIEALKELLATNQKPSGVHFQFEHWPQIDIKLSGAKYHGTLTSTAMNGLLEIQGAVHKSYAMLRYKNSAHRLTEEEKSKLEIVVGVEKGSSEIEVDLTGPLETIAQGFVNMDSAHQLIAIIAVGLIWGGTAMFKKYIDERRNVRIREIESEERRASLQQIENLSAQDTERVRVVTKAMDVEPQLKVIERVTKDSMMSLVKVASKSDEAKIQGLLLSGDQASELKASARGARTPELLTGRYSIKAVDSSRPDVFRVSLQNTSDDSVVKVNIDIDAESRRTRELIRAAQWDRFEIDAIIEVDRISDRTEGVAILKASRVSEAVEN